MTLKLGMQHGVLQYYQVCSNDAPGLTLTYFMARSNLVAFIWEKVKTMNFSETTVAYDVGRCSQLNEYMKLWVPKVRVIHWPCSKSLRFNILNFFSSITTDFNISSALRWAIQDQWSSGLLLSPKQLLLIYNILAQRNSYIRSVIIQNKVKIFAKACKYWYKATPNW